MAQTPPLEHAQEDGEQRPPEDAMPLERAELWPVLKRTVKNFQAHQMLDHAASLTYYLMLSLFPALLVAVSLTGLLGTPQLVTNAVEYVRDAGAPRSVVDALEASLTNLIRNASEAVSVTAVIGLLTALYGASGAFGAAGRALNVVYGVEEDRSFVRQKLQNLLFTLVVVVLAVIALVSILLGGSLAEDVFGLVGLGSTAASVWTYARWLAALLAAVLIYAIVYAFAPDISPRRFRWLSPGAIVGVLIWLVASVGFFFYVSNFGNYGATYGTFATAVILLLFFWLTNLCLLLGGELNAELERAETAGRAGPPPPTPPPTAQGRVPPIPTAPGPAREAQRYDA